MTSRLLRALRQAEAAAAILILCVLVAVVFIGTVGRYSGNPVLWSDEAAQALFVWLSLLAGDLTLQRQGHFRIDFLANLLGPVTRRALDVTIYLLVGLLLALLIYYGAAFVKISHMRPLPMLRLPSSFATAALPVGFTLMLITVVEIILGRATGALGAEVEQRDVA